MKLRDAQREIEKINYLGENNPLNDVINEGPWTKEAWRKAKVISEMEIHHINM